MSKSMLKLKKDSKKKKKKIDYYDAFEAQADLAVKEAKLLRKMVSDFDSIDDMKLVYKQAHEIEHEADEICRKVTEVLVTDFVTPIDREDIVSIARNLDEIIDDVEEIIQRFYMFDIHSVHDDALVFAKLIVSSCEALSKAVADFRNCKKSSKFKTLVLRVKELEDEADNLYLRAIRDLYINEYDNPMYVMAWVRLFDVMEDCVDQCDLVAHQMSAMMVKYA